ncbi:MAG: L,D-transpeptidase [Cocleimonas sp.]
MPETSNNLKQNDISRFKSLLDDLKRCFPEHFSQSTNKVTKDIIEQTVLIISIAEQKLYLIKSQKLENSYPISSAEAGIGNKSGSYQTPLGTHRISEKFGENALISSIFKARKNTHTVAEILNNPNTKSKDDNITSRILWLDGLEEGSNKGLDKDGNNVDSHSRYIYIHGTDEEGRLGKAASHGCIRMANNDVIELFNEVQIGCLVIITEH